MVVNKVTDWDMSAFIIWYVIMAYFCGKMLMKWKKVGIDLIDGAKSLSLPVNDVRIFFGFIKMQHGL